MKGDITFLGWIKVLSWSFSTVIKRCSAVLIAIAYSKKYYNYDVSYYHFLLKLAATRMHHWFSSRSLLYCWLVGLSAMSTIKSFHPFNLFIVSWKALFQEKKWNRNFYQFSNDLILILYLYARYFNLH